MNLTELINLRDEISALLLSKVDGDVNAEHVLVTQAANQLEQMGCLGGSTRSKAEGEIIRLVQRFDDTHESGFGPWPVSDFMLTHSARERAYCDALMITILAHKTGNYERMVFAIEAAENLISDLDVKDISP